LPGHTPAVSASDLARDAATALNAGDKAAFSRHLAALAGAGVTTLSLRGQMLEARGMACLTEVLDEQCRQPGGLPFTAIDFSDAWLPGLPALLTALQAHDGGGLTALDFSGTQGLPDPRPAAGPLALGLDEAAIDALVAFVGRSPALRTLHLNRQPALGLLPFLNRLASGQFVHQQPPLLRLLGALKTSSVETLALRDCHLCPQDWRNLTEGLNGLALQCLDLEGNDQMAAVLRLDTCMGLLGFVASLDNAGTLVELRLPLEATAWALSGLRALPADHGLRARLALPGNHALRCLSPLMDSPAEPLAPVRQAVARNRGNLERLRVLALCLREAPALQNASHSGLPRELQQRLIETLAAHQGMADAVPPAAQAFTAAPQSQTPGPGHA
jgi:hypothetical protein